MTVAPPYHPHVLARFAAPTRAGDVHGRYPLEIRGEAAESQSGCRVVLAAGVDGRVFREVRFRVFGCPHLVAAAEEWCRHAEGRRADDRARPAIADLMALLDVPVEKTGRILLLEDAWRDLEQQLAPEPTTARSDQ